MIGLRQRRGGSAERAAILEELVHRQEGLSAGVKEVLARAGNRADAPFRHVFGLVADLLSASVEAAPLIEIALDQTAHYVVASPRNELIDYLQKEGHRFAGRVGFIWFDARWEETAHGQANLEGQPGVLGRADNFVETEPRFVPLARRLLCRTWLVENLSQAQRLAENVGRGFNFVTLSGELLQADGTLVVGPRHGSTGLITRRSELRALHSQLEELQTAIAAAETAVAGREAQIADQQQLVAARESERQQSADHLAQNRLLMTAAEDAAHNWTSNASSSSPNSPRPRSNIKRPLNSWSKPNKSEKNSTGTWPNPKNFCNKWASRSTAWRINASCTAAKPPRSRWNWPRAKSGCAISKPACANWRKIGRSVIGQWKKAANAWPNAASGPRPRAGTSCAESEIAELYLRKESSAQQTVNLVNEREELRAARGIDRRGAKNPRQGPQARG